MLADWLARMVGHGCSHAVLEVSSHALAQSRTAGIEFDGACMTNVRRDHLDFHNSLKNYRDAKSRLLKQLSPGGFAVLNADDPVCRQIRVAGDGAALTIGIENQAEVDRHDRRTAARASKHFCCKPAATPCRCERKSSATVTFTTA